MGEIMTRYFYTYILIDGRKGLYYVEARSAAHALAAASKFMQFTSWGVKSWAYAGDNYVSH